MDKSNVEQMGVKATTTFSSKLTTVLVAAGCSVGLGNIWRFPYVAGENGGGAFLLIYLAAIVIIGLPIMLSEFLVGRQTNLSAVGAFRKLSHNWKWLGYNGVLAAFLVMGFYYVVAGWTAEYFVFSATGQLMQQTTTEGYAELFKSFVTNPWRPLIFTWIFIAVSHLIIHLGVEKGLERVSKVLMPLLFLILIILAVKALLMPNSWEGVKFFISPDFSKVTTQTILQAVGQAFFSLSVGLGALVAYGSYIPQDANLRTTALQVTLLDTSVAIIAGLIIFPACFSAGIDPQSGPALVFQTLPAIFNTMPLSSLWATIFFLLLIIAALTSTMSLHEVATVYFLEEWNIPRKKGAILTSIIVGVLGTIASLSMGVWSGFTIGGKNLFDLFDYVTANIMLPLGGLLTCIFVGYVMDKKLVEKQMTNSGKYGNLYYKNMRFLLRYICPIVILVIFLDSIGLIK